MARKEMWADGNKRMVEEVEGTGRCLTLLAASLGIHHHHGCEHHVAHRRHNVGHLQRHTHKGATVNFRPAWNKTQHHWCWVNMRSFLVLSPSLSVSSLTASSSSAVTLLSLPPSCTSSLTLPPVLKILLRRIGVCRERSLHSLHTHVPLKGQRKPKEVWPQPRTSLASGYRGRVEKWKRNAAQCQALSFFMAFNEVQYYMQNSCSSSDYFKSLPFSPVLFLFFSLAHFVSLLTPQMEH